MIHFSLVKQDLLARFIDFEMKTMSLILGIDTSGNFRFLASF